MKLIKYITILFITICTGCTKLIDVEPLSNTNAANYYTNLSEVNIALTGCYNGLQKTMVDEWTLTELRSDNVIQGVAGSTAVANRDLSDLDMFFPNVSHQGVYTYWLNTYNNLRNINTVLNSLNVNYTASTGALSYDANTLPGSDVDKKLVAAEATFLRAHHYFNLVRLYGGVFLVHEPISPEEAKSINRTTVDEIYKLIIADLQNTVSNGLTARFNNILPANLGRANSWSAKALLAKVYLTLNRKTDAIALLQDIITNSGYTLQPSYANVFSVSNEMNSEILFAVRYKAGGVGLGSPFPNAFAPIGSGSSIVNGDGRGLMYPSSELNTSYTLINLTGASVKKDSTRVVLAAANAGILPGMFVTGTQIAPGTTVEVIAGNILTLSTPAINTSTTAALTIGDPRRTASIGVFNTRLYPQKHMSAVGIANDGENDWPIIRYADVLLMIAEAQGNSVASIGLINQTRNRAKLSSLSPATITTTALFETALSQERRLEFAFENQRWFDLLRFKTTFTTITPEQRMKDHIAAIYAVHYGVYPTPRLTLAEIQAFVVPNRMLLPIPQREIDNNTKIVIAQNPGY
jgi:starch-binding outer membrane protein, SusD/RagB family